MKIHHSKAMNGLAAGAALAAPYAAFAVVFSHAAMPFDETAAMLWLPAGYAMGVMPLLDPPGWGAILVSDFLMRAFVFDRAGLPPGGCLALAAIGSTAIAAAAALIRRFRGAPGDPPSGAFFLLLFIPGMFVNGMSAAACAFTVGAYAPGAALSSVPPWFLSQLPAYFCVAPLILIWSSRGLPAWIRSLRARAAELAIVAAGTLASAWYGFGGASSPTPAGAFAPYMVLPFLIAAMLRFDLRIVSALLGAVLGIAISRTAGGAQASDALPAAESAVSLLSACLLVATASLASRAREQQRCVEENEQSRACLETGGWAHYRIDRDGAIHWSGNASEVLATGEHSLPASVEEWLLRMDPSQRDDMRKRYRDLFAGRPGAAREFTVRHSENSEVHCEDVAKPFRAGHDGAWEVAGFIRNTTVLRALHDELRRARPVVSVGRIAGTIAHDLANVLSIIHGHSQLIAASPEQANTGRLTAAITAAADRGRQLCRQILFIARPRALRDDVKAEDLVHELRTMLTGLARPGVAISTEVEHGDLVLHCNAGRLLQALLNLSINALESMEEEGGVLKIRCFHVRNESPFPSALGIVHVGEFACFELSDNGEGIPQGLLRRIFEPGYSTKDGDAPRGLGLAIIASVLTEVGAFLDVESRAAVETAGATGTTFKVYVPCPAAPAAIADAAAKVLPSARLGIGESILIIDFDEENLLRMEDMVAGIGYEPNAFSDCDAAMRSVETPNGYKAAIVAGNVTLPDGTPFYDVLARYMPSFKIVLVSRNRQGLPTTTMPALIEPFTHSDLGAVLAKVVNT